MSVLYITEYSDVGYGGGHVIPIAAEPNNNVQTVGITATSATSTVFKNNTKMVRLHTDAICSIAFGTAPVASSTTARMAQNQTEYYVIPINQSYKVAVITNS